MPSFSHSSGAPYFPFSQAELLQAAQNKHVFHFSIPLQIRRETDIRSTEYACFPLFNSLTN